MFEKALSEQLKRIFDVKKVSFDTPGESAEQECLFVSVESSRNSIKEGRQLAKVQGKLTMIANSEKLPFGFFSKKISEAEIEDTSSFFFYEFEENAGRILNIAERSVSFVYFFNSQYDPERGTMTSIELTGVSE